MKYFGILILFGLLILHLLPAHAQIPRSISFQGVLTDVDGHPVEDGNRRLTFSLYSDELSTTALWTETQIVNIRAGVFNATLGSIIPLSPAFDMQYYLGIAVDGAPELLPRTPLSSAPYALHADLASGLVPGAGGVVSSLNSATGAITLEGGGGTTVTRMEDIITISSISGTGIQNVRNTDGTISILDPNGPMTTLGLIDGSVSESKLAHLAVSTPKLANHAVTMAKIEDGAVTRVKIQDGAVTPQKISNTGATAGQVLLYDGTDIIWETPATSEITGSGVAGQLALWSSANELDGSTSLVFTDNKLGVGTTPSATLHVTGNDGILATGSHGNGATMNPGAGERVHWYPKKAAFRTGSVDGTQWNDANVGQYSNAMGQNTIASGSGSIALGIGTSAESRASTAMGNNTIASGNHSTAMGNNTIASGYYSTAMGSGTSAEGNNATTMGNNTIASGYVSTAMGGNTTASGKYSTTTGINTTASGSYSTAMGSYATTAGWRGAFAIGDRSSTTDVTCNAENQMVMRFAGGYRLFTNGVLTTGVYMNGGVSGWTNYSDRNKKENFSAIDGEALLQKIRLIPVTEWNYIGSDTSVRYIGPTAQDFWQAFRLGGTDSLGINSIAINGVNLAAIKALEQRSTELREAVSKNATLEARIAALESIVAQIPELESIIDRIAELEAQLQETAKIVEELEAANGELALTPQTHEIRHVSLGETEILQ